MNDESLNVRRYERGEYETLCQDYLTLAGELASQLRGISDQLPDDEPVTVAFPAETTTVVSVSKEGDSLRYIYDAEQRRSTVRGLTVEQAREAGEWQEIGNGTDFAHISDFYRLLSARHSTAIKAGILYPDSSPWRDAPQ